MWNIKKYCKRTIKSQRPRAVLQDQEVCCWNGNGEGTISEENTKTTMKGKSDSLEASWGERKTGNVGRGKWTLVKELVLYCMLMKPINEQTPLSL